MTPTELRAWRETRGLRRPAAAELLGLNLRTLEALEDGRSAGTTVLPILARLTAEIDRADALERRVA